MSTSGSSIGTPIIDSNALTGALRTLKEVVPGLVELEVAVPHLSPAVR